MAFAFVCHPEVLPIYTELKEYVSCGWKRDWDCLELVWGKWMGPGLGGRVGNTIQVTWPVIHGCYGDIRGKKETPFFCQIVRMW